MCDEIVELVPFTANALPCFKIATLILLCQQLHVLVWQQWVVHHGDLLACLPEAQTAAERHDIAGEAKKNHRCLAFALFEMPTKPEWNLLRCSQARSAPMETNRI